MLLIKKPTKILAALMLFSVILVSFSPYVASAQRDAGVTETQQTQQSAYESFANAGVGCSNGFNLAKFFTLCIPMGGLFLSSKALFYSAAFFDNFLYFSIHSSYLRLGSIDTMWTSIKDLANLAFILGLIYISFTLILGTGGKSSRDFFVRLIIIAILLNFSLFISKIVIDAGNITAETFYNAISAPPIDGDNNFVSNLIGDAVSGAQGVASGGNAADKGKTISGAIVQIFNPARMFDAEVFKSFVEETEGVIGFKLMLVIGAFSVISVMTAIELFFAGFFFISRTIWLILLMVISPLAFVSYFIPAFKGKFKQWFSMLVERSFCLIPYIFAIWALILITGSGEGGSGIGESAQQASGTPDSVLMIIILQFAMVYAVLKIARTQSKKMCEGGMGVSGMLTSVTKKAAGFGLGIATGGVGMVARGTAGRLAYRTMEGDNALGRSIKNSAANGNTAALFARNRLKNISNLKFGTTDGFEGKLKTEANKKMGMADEIENLKTGQMAKSLEERRIKEMTSKDPNLSKDDAKAKYRSSRQYTKDADNASEIGRAYGTNLLDSRSSSGSGNKLSTRFDEEENKELIIKESDRNAGVLRRMFDASAAGITPASDEALARRKKQIQIDKDKNIEIQRKKEDQAKSAQQAAMQKAEIDRDVQKATDALLAATAGFGNITVPTPAQSAPVEAKGDLPTQDQAATPNVSATDQTTDTPEVRVVGTPGAPVGSDKSPELPEQKSAADEKSNTGEVPPAATGQSRAYEKAQAQSETPVNDNEQVEAGIEQVLGKVEELASMAIAGVRKDEEGKVIDADQKAEIETIKSAAKTGIREALAFTRGDKVDVARRDRLIRKEIQDREQALKIEREEKNILEQLEKDMRENNQEADLDETKRALLEKYNIAHSGEYVGQKSFSAVTTQLAKSRSSFEDVKNQLNKSNQDLKSLEREKTTLEKKERKNIETALKSVTNPLKARINSRVRSGQIEFQVRSENALEEANVGIAGVEKDRIASQNPQLQDRQ